jgi:hypothetical protein
MLNKIIFIFAFLTINSSFPHKIISKKLVINKLKIKNMFEDRFLDATLLLYCNKLTLLTKK